MSENQPARESGAAEPGRVPGDSQSAGRIVVGVDGSDGSLAALAWAVGEAKLRGIRLHAVLAWQPPEFYPAPNGWTPRRGPSGESAQQLADAALAEVTGHGEAAAAGQGVTISCEAVEGHPAQMLVLSAEDAAMVVVGSRGHGGFLGALLGSVSQHVAAHARCPVVVIPDPGRERIRS
ncbi:universal stress protein UspA [Arthrobacter livingstonensis]|uniref:Universal stress protein UspA n=1 Tax=Arthrobacter livingstonensis TaxID=670078 RepID=A0A2V5L4A8_9MICC|nr:universal stress protein [Arthrobacter livingstonensis]PYI64543.1 universal stress protein UspA [Arthrobacter livingstonensis]